ncbi:hypothetical protein ACTXT7_000282 [Hymenolepis weldensis]
MADSFRKQIILTDIDLSSSFERMSSSSSLFVHFPVNPPESYLKRHKQSICKSTFGDFWSVLNVAKSEVTKPLIIGNRSMIRMANRTDQMEVLVTVMKQ